MRKFFSLCIVFLSISSALFAQNADGSRYKLGVYVTVTGAQDEQSAKNIKAIAQGTASNALISSGKYEMIERSGEFLQQIEEEQKYQMSGDVRDDQISQIGASYGAQKICVVGITIGGSYLYVAARIVDVVTKTSSESGEADNENYSGISKIRPTVLSAINQILGISAPIVYGGKEPGSTVYTSNPSTQVYEKSNPEETRNIVTEPIRQTVRLSEGLDNIFVVNGVTFKMVFVKGGSMNLGCNSGSGSFGGNEKPIHNVTLSDYYMGETEVTQALWKAVMGYGNNPSNWKGDQLPVEIVSWNDCERFVSLLNNLLAGQLPNGYSFSLPSEAQWEYAARGGQKSSGNTYAGSSNVGSVAWYDGNSNSRTHEVKQKNPNELGLYDMSGNVCEWCEDWYDYYWYSYNKKWTDPVNKFGTSSDGHVLRGGSWRGEASYSRVSCRANSSPSFRNSHIGFRLALVRR